MKEGHIFTEGEIGADYPDLIAAQLARIGEVDKIIHHVSSPGGNVIAGYKGYHKLIGIGKPIDTIVEGEAQSMGSFVMMASNATGGKIKILNPSRVMIHMPKFNVQGLTNSGFADSDALQSGADELKTIEQEMAEVYANSTVKRNKAKTIDEIKAMMKKETYMSAQDAVNLGFADEVINMVNKEENTKLKAVALGLTGTNNKAMEKGNGIAATVADLLTKAANMLKDSGAKAVELALKEGGTLNVDGEEAVVGANATIDGKPADGAYTLEDGKTVKCVAGKVTEITPAAAPAQPQETEAQKLARENNELKAQLAAKTQAEQAAQQAEQVKLAEAEKQKQAVAVVDLQKKIDELQKMTIGDASKQSEGNVANKAIAIGGTFKDKSQLYATRTYLAENLPWIEHTEPFQKKYPNGRFSDGTHFRDYHFGGPCAVSILETNLSYTWNGILATELFFKPTLSSPALSDLFTIDLGATDTKRYHIAPTASKILKPYTGCAQAVTGTSLDVTDKKIQLKPFEMYEGFCKDDFTNQLSGSYNVLAQEWLKTGVDSFDPAGTPIDRMIVQLLKDGLRRDIFRRVSFGDTTSPSADWNQIDGAWQSWIDQAGASNYCIYRETSTTLGTGALSADVALNTMKAIYKNSSNLLKEYVIDSGSGRWLCTRSFWENYYDSLVSAGSVSEAEYENLQNGIKRLMYKGIPLYPVTIWDDFLADSTNPLAATTKHLVALTSKDNHILGVENTGDLNKIDSWFEKKDNKRYYRSNMVFGFLGAIHCDLTSIAY